MKKIVVVYLNENQMNDVGEVEGVFDENDELLDFWSCNDATWRSEYFSPFMEKLGIELEDIGQNSKRFKNLQIKLYKSVKELWG